MRYKSVLLASLGIIVPLGLFVLGASSSEQEAGLPKCASEQTLKSLSDLTYPNLTRINVDTALERASSKDKRWCQVSAWGRLDRLRAVDVAFTIEWTNQSKGEYLLQVQSVSPY